MSVHFVPEFLRLSYEARWQFISHSYGIIGKSCPLDSQEAAMAQIILDTGHQEETIRSRFGARFALLREMLDAFVSYRMRVAAAEAEHVRSRQTPNAQLLSTNVR